jgi:hypothetical protein
MNVNTTASIKESLSVVMKGNSSDILDLGDSSNIESLIDLNETLIQASEKLMTQLLSEGKLNSQIQRAPWMIGGEVFPQELKPKPFSTLDYGADNEAKEIDEADLIKIDGRFVYVAYGNLLVIWDIETGDLIANYTPPDWQISTLTSLFNFDTHAPTPRFSPSENEIQSPHLPIPTDFVQLLPIPPSLSQSPVSELILLPIMTTESSTIPLSDSSQAAGSDSPNPHFEFTHLEQWQDISNNPSTSPSSPVPTSTPICFESFGTASPSTINSNSKCPRASSRPFWYYDHFRLRIRGIFIKRNRVILLLESLVNESSFFSFDQRNQYYIHIVILDTSSLPQSFDIISHQFISHGQYETAVSTGSDIHVVTSIPVDYTSLEIEIQNLWTINMTVSEFETAFNKVAPSLIKSFLSSVMDRITRNGTIPKYSSWWPSQTNNSSLAEAFARKEVKYFIMSTLVSFADSQINFTFADAGFFSPFPIKNIYPLKDQLILVFGASQESIFYRLSLNEGEAASNSFLISLIGDIADRSSVSISGDYIRVATESTDIKETIEGIEIIETEIKHTISLSILKIPNRNETKSRIVSQISVFIDDTFFSYLRCFKDICYMGKF